MRRSTMTISTGAAAVAVLAGIVAATQLGGSTSGVRASAATAPAPASTATSSARPVVVAAAPALVAASTSSVATSSALTARIRAQMARATARRWSAVVDIEGVGRVVSVNGSTAFRPASTEKIFTTLPLLAAQPQARLVTTVGAATAPVRGVLHGDLVVRASGDPTLLGSTLTTMARRVRTAGVRRVTGRLVLDIGSLSLSRARPGWKASYVPGDVAPLSPFPVEHDTWRGTAAYRRNPTVANLNLFRARLASFGVRIARGSVVSRTGSTAKVFTAHSSVTIASIVRSTLRDSINFNAEQLLSIAGGLTRVAATARTVQAAGTATDGSGLSLLDRRTALAEVALLRSAHASRVGRQLLVSLPVACRSGTLRHEMCGTSAAGKVFAKTGTLDHVKALAGYTTDAKGRWVTFAFLTTGDASTSQAMRAIERSVLAIRRYAG